MTAPDLHPPPPAILTRRMDDATERAYVWSTARKITANRWGGPIAHYPTIIRHVDAILETCIVTVATFADRPDGILGFVAWGRDGSLEFLSLNLSLANDGRAPGELHPPKGYRLRARRLACDVLHALLAEPVVVMRRLSSPWVIEAMAWAGFQVSIVPVGV